MQSLEAGTELADLVEFITGTVKDLVQTKMFLQTDGNDALSEQITKQMIRILRKSLQSEREQYLQSLLQKLDQVNEDKYDLEMEYNRAKHYNHRQTQKLTIENETLKQKYEELASKVESTEWRHERKQQMAKEALRQKEATVANLHAVIDDVESTYAHLQHDVEGLKLAALKMQRVEQKLIHQAREMCTDELRRTVREITANQQTVRDRRISRLKAAIETEKRQQRKLERACESVLDGVWSLTSDDKEHPDVSVKNFPQRVGELQQIVNTAIEKAKKKANQAFLAEINQEMGGSGFVSPDETIQAAIERYVNEKVSEKEKQCEELLKAGAERERELRQHLESIRGKIQRLQGNAQSDDLDISERSQKPDTSLTSRTLTILQYSDSE